jgi:hypothetical protein
MPRYPFDDSAGSLRALLTLVCMADLSRAFMIESARREIEHCTDIERLKCITISLMQQCEALREMTKTMLLKEGYLP